MVRRDSTGYGMTMAITSAATFGTSGSFARPLLDIGWTPGAVVLARVGGAAVIMLPSLWLLRRTRMPSGRDLAHMLAYGAFAVASATFCYFEAIQYLSVAVALLCEYFAPVLLLGYRWARTRRRPPWVVLLGAAVAMAGMTVVLDVFGSGNIDPRGLLWGFAAAISASTYFLLGEHSGDDLPPMLVTGVGLIAGAVLLGVGGIVGLIPMHVRLADVLLAGGHVSWLLPVIGVVLLATVIAYATGILGIRALGVRVSSFVSLTEVLFAVVAATILVAQKPTVLQGIGAVVVLIGIALVQRGDQAEAAAAQPDPLPATEPAPSP